MSGGVQTPEELDTLFEDTLVLRDGQALAALFEDGAGQHSDRGAGAGAASGPMGSVHRNAPTDSSA